MFSAIACTAIFIAILLAAAAAKSQESADNKDFLRRAFLKHDFSAKFFGPARWLNGGEAYTTVEALPGAKGARVNEFIDVILTDWATESERRAFLNGLAGVDNKSNELYGKNFVDASADQQTTLLRAMDDAAMAAHGNRRPRHGNTIPEERDKQLQGSFWDVFKGITIHGYYTSEIGFTQEENLQIIPGAYHGCVPLTAEKKA